MPAYISTLEVCFFNLLFYIDNKSFLFVHTEYRVFWICKLENVLKILNICLFTYPSIVRLSVRLFVQSCPNHTSALENKWNLSMVYVA